MIAVPIAAFVTFIAVACLVAWSKAARRETVWQAGGSYDDDSHGNCSTMGAASGGCGGCGGGCGGCGGCGG